MTDEEKPIKRSKPLNHEYHEIKLKAPEMIAQSFGNITVAAGKLGIDRRTIYEWMWNDKEFEEVVEAARRLGREYIIDEAEVLHRMHSKTNPTSVMYTLNSKPGRARGWGDKKDAEVTINHKPTKVDDEIIAEYIARLSESK